MKRETITHMLNTLDESYIGEAAAFSPYAVQESPERIAHMKKKRILGFALAAALLLSLGMVAYAADLFGLRALYANHNRGEMPEAAAALINAQEAETAGEGWQARVLESYCDEGTVLLTVAFRADEDYILAPASEDPNSPLWTIGLTGEGTLGDYALREGKTLLFAEAALGGESLGLDGSSLHFESASPRELTVFFEGTRRGGVCGDVAANCAVVVVPWAPDEGEPSAAERRSLPVTLREGCGEPLGVYAPAEPMAVPGVELGELSLTRTPLGLRLRLRMQLRDEEAARQLLTLQLEGVEFHGSGVLDPDGECVFEQGQGDFGESPTITFLDWDKETIAEVRFEKIG